MIIDGYPVSAPETARPSSCSDRPRRRSGPHLGYWASDLCPYLPQPIDFVDEDWDLDERMMVVEYLQAGEIKTQWRGGSYCRLCDRKGSTGMGSKCLTDGTYTWPEGFAHYVEDHAVKPPQEFIDHIRRQRK